MLIPRPNVFNIWVLEWAEAFFQKGAEIAILTPLKPQD